MEAMTPNLGWCGLLVEGPKTVNGEQRLPGIQQRPDHVCDAIRSCSRGERVLEGHASSLELRSALLCHGVRSPPLPVSPVTMPLMLCCHGSHGQRIRDFSWQIRLAHMICCLCDEVASASSSNTLKCSFVSPANPAAEPRGALRRLLAYFSWSNSKWW